MEKTTTPGAVVRLKKDIKILYRTWWTAHYLIGLVSVLAGTLLTELPTTTGATFLPKWLTGSGWVIGMIAAVSTGMITFLAPIGKAERYWAAYHSLDQACLEYEHEALSLRKFLARVNKARAQLRVTTSSEIDEQKETGSHNSDDHGHTDHHSNGSKANVTEMEQRLQA
jgi:hypothetical protein